MKTPTPEAEANASAPTQPVAPADALKLLQEMVDLCALGDIDEDANDGLGWAGLVRDAKALIADAASACQVPSDSPPWRVAEVWSSTTPHKPIPWLATHAQDQARVELHRDFIRWLSPAAPVAPKEK